MPSPGPAAPEPIEEYAARILAAQAAEATIKVVVPLADAAGLVRGYGGEAVAP